MVGTRLERNLGEGTKVRSLFVRTPWTMVTVMSKKVFQQGPFKKTLVAELATSFENVRNVGM
jgi:hypothetical protein